jgi:hypothetical protein
MCTSIRKNHHTFALTWMCSYVFFVCLEQIFQSVCYHEISRYIFWKDIACKSILFSILKKTELNILYSFENINRKAK